MKLLVLTQKVDKNDPVLGFFHRWLEEFGSRFEKISVICLEKGTFNLPQNVHVYSLGKDERKSRLQYIWMFYKYIWDLRGQYDSVFVHMNQEYVLLGGEIWRAMGKRVYLWRNHAVGNILTRAAVVLSHKVFYTSPQSYTARFRNAVQMPIGVDTEFFKPGENIERIQNSVLFLGRISPVKRVMEFLDWVKGKPYTATLAGPILEADKEYGEKVLRSLPSGAKYVGPVNQEEARELYQTHEIYANFTPAGSFDKTIVEAAACGMKLEIRNPDLQSVNVEEHSLSNLMDKLTKEIK